MTTTAFPDVQLNVSDIRLAVITRSFAGRNESIRAAISCHFVALAGPEIAELIYVLDNTPEDHDLGNELLQKARAHGFHHLRIEYEDLPAKYDKMFRGRLNDGIGGPGKDRSQWSNFYTDHYTDADAVGIIDAEACLVAPPVAQHVIEGGRLHNVVDAFVPSADKWGVDEWVLQLSTPLDVMWPNRFPIWFWRADFVHIRRHLVRRFEISDDVSDFDTQFDAAFSAIMMHAKYTWGYGNRRYVRLPRIRISGTGRWRRLLRLLALLLLLPHTSLMRSLSCSLACSLPRRATHSSISWSTTSSITDLAATPSM